MVTDDLYPEIHPMSWRGALIAVHDRFCFPVMVPIVRVITVTAGVLSVVLFLYAHVTGQ